MESQHRRASQVICIAFRTSDLIWTPFVWTLFSGYGVCTAELWLQENAFKWILKKLVTSVRTGSVWLRTQTGSGPPDTVISEYFFTN
jgi:hypothetical protein